MKKLVSVVIPTFNRAIFLDRSIKSVLQQTYQNFELIIINDGSTDETEEKVKEYQKLDKRIIYIKNKKNQGPSAARNIGIKSARGEFIAFLDDDDEWLPTKIEKQVHILESLPPQHALCFTAFWIVRGGEKTYSPDKELKAICYDNKKIRERLLALLSFIPQPSSILVRKECLFNVGLFDEKMSAFEDYDLFFKLSRRYFFKFIDSPLWYYHKTPNSLSSRIGEICMKARIYLLNKHFDEIKKNKKILSNLYQEIGHFYMLKNKEKMAKNYFKKGIKNNPLNLLVLFQFVISILGRDFYLFCSKIKKIILTTTLKKIKSII